VGITLPLLLGICKLRGNRFRFLGCCTYMLISKNMFGLCALLLVSLGRAQSAPVDSSAKQYLLLPFGAYAEETGGQFGALGMYFFPAEIPGEPGPMLVATAVMTTSGQKILMLGPSGSWDEGRMELTAFFNYTDWPGNYWAGGNQPSAAASSYEMESIGLNGKVLFSGSYLRESLKNLKGGLLYNVESNTTAFDLDSGVSAPSVLSGGRRVGLGPELQWDTRDHQGWPTKGRLFSLGKVFYKDLWGSDWGFNKTTLDLRSYHAFYGDYVLALGGLWERADGAVPFDQLATPDGSNHLRGLEKGRLRDKQQLVLQSEIRVPLPGRFAAVAFAEAGKVGPTFGDMLDNEYHSAYGGGLRFNVNTERRLNFRLDAAWVDQSVGFAASFGEAF
jgi:hypothetical protein